MNLRFLRSPLARFAVTIVACAAIGCSKKQSPDSSAVDAAPNPPESSAAPAASFVPGTGLANLLLNESHTRPANTPKAEDVYAALGKAGMKIVDQKQHAATPFGAKFCLGAEVENQLSLSVCEFDSAAAAEGGRAMSLKAFKTVLNRELLINKATMLTVREYSKTPEIDAVSKRVQQLFTAL
jgi:hypothetical protein